MRDLSKQSRIWKFAGCVSAISGLVCFGLSSTYNMSFGKWGYGGLLVYLLVCLFMLYLIVGAKRIRVSEKVQGVVAALIFVVICSTSIVHDKLVTRKSDALSMISYGSFALMSLSMSRKFELGFETGLSTFFLSFFASQLFKIKWILLPIALVSCSLIIILRHHYSESAVQFNSSSPNGYHAIEVGPPNAAVIEIGDDESQDPPGMGEVSGQSLLSSNNEQNNQEESSEAIHHSPSDGEISEGSILDRDNEQNNEQEEDASSFPTESMDQYNVSSANNRVTIQNGFMHSSPSAPPRELLRSSS